MRFFKYLIFFSIILFSSSSNALFYISGEKERTSASTYQASCQKLASYYNSVLSNNGQYTYSVGTGLVSTYCPIKRSDGGLLHNDILSETIICPSATEVTLKVAINAQKYQCVENCQYALRGCVDIDFEPGMTCSAISTGIECGKTPPTLPKDPADTSKTPDSSDIPAAPGQSSSGTNTNTASTTGTSTSTSTTTTNTTDNTSTTTTTTTNNNTTKIDLSSLEKTIETVGKLLGDKIDAIKDALGGDSGSENGSPDGTDLTETNSKLDDIKENGTDLNDWLKVGKENGELGDKPFGTDETPKKEITTQTLKTNIFGSSSACPADRNLSMNFLGRSFQKTFSFSLWCEQLAILGSLILISAYLFGAYIIASKS